MAPATTPWRVRAAASLLALLITGLGVHALLAEIHLRTPPPSRPPVIYVEGPWITRAPDPLEVARPVAPLALPTRTTPRVEATPRAPAVSRAPAASSRGAVPAPAREPSTAISVPAADAALTPTPDAADRRALDLSAGVLRAAAHDSRSSLRRMAAASGRAPGNEPRSQAQLMASSMARAGKPHCIAPNEGGNLLSVFVIAYEAMREQCR